MFCPSALTNTPSKGQIHLEGWACISPLPDFQVLHKEHYPPTHTLWLCKVPFFSYPGFPHRFSMCSGVDIQPCVQELCIPPSYLGEVSGRMAEDIEQGTPGSQIMGK